MLGIRFFAGCFRLAGFLFAGRLNALWLAAVGFFPCACERQTPEVAVVEEEPAATVLTPEEQRIDAILDHPELFKPIDEVVSDEEEVPFALNKAARVAVLCYHDFHESAATDMVMPAAKFRAQMAAIAEAGIAVISMNDFLSWLRGERNVPDPSIVITIDDGWKAVHSIAMPILSEHGFPFTVFLYQNYLNVGGRSLSLADIEELKKNGAQIGCHSVSHTNMADQADRSEDAYRSYLRFELGESKRFLEELTGEVPRVFAYPFGKYNDRVVEAALEHGYEALFTVNGKRAAWEDPRAEIGRFVIHGNNDYNFDLAMGFPDRGGPEDTLPLLANDTDLPVSLFPAPEAKVDDRRPVIRVDVSSLGGVIEESIRLVVGGFGVVPAVYDASTGVVSCRVPRKLRHSRCVVVFSVRVNGREEPYVLPWRFHVDQGAHYLEAAGPMNKKKPALSPAREAGHDERG
jgi:peptidoglycan/xylan/chitin deacetylase (PgdA/CDA1 family)